MNVGINMSDTVKRKKNRNNIVFTSYFLSFASKLMRTKQEQDALLKDMYLVPACYWKQLHYEP